MDVYVSAFMERCEDRPTIEMPGLVGVGPPVVRLLVTDDRAYDALAALLPEASAGMINVFADAVRCTELVTWRSEATTALIRRELETVPPAPLPSELRLRPVGPDGVPLERAAAIVEEGFASYLRQLPASTRLLAAVDADGVVRATSGYDTVGGVANVLFVNTVSDWRGRGIGRAMTAAALLAAREDGARRACLDATDAGLSIYRRLGFEVVSRNTRFFRRSTAAG